MQANGNGAQSSSSSSLVCYWRQDSSAFEMHNVQTGPAAHPDSCVYRCSLPRVKQTKRGADTSPPSSAEVKNGCSCTGTALCACEVRYRETIGLYLLLLLLLLSSSHLCRVFTIMCLKQTMYRRVPYTVLQLSCSYNL